MGSTNTSDQKFLAKFVELSPDIFAVANAQGYLEYANQPMIDLLGYSREELMSQPFVNFIHPDDRESTKNEMKDLLNGKTTFNFENRYLTKSGQVLWLYWSAKLADDGLVYGVAKEISRFKELEEWHMINKKKLEKTNQELNDFAYIVSHDLKAPLRGISSLAQWMLEDHGDKLEKDCKGDLGLLMDRAKHADSLIDSLLEYSRAGNKNLELEVINTHELIDEILMTLEHPDSIKINIADNLPKINYSRTQFYQIMQNLISNSIKYMDKEQGLIEIDCEEEDKFFLFSVKDNGIGIDKKHHERIFKIFQTVGAESKESTGVGLAIVKKMVERLSGKIELESEIGKGTKIKIFISKEIDEVTIDG